MFKNYLRVFPKGVQISIFIGLWVAFFLIGSLLSGLVQTNFFGVPLNSDGLAAKPQLSMVLNVILQIFMFGLPALVFAYLADPKMDHYLGLKNGAKRLSPIAWVLIAAFMILLVSSLAGLINTIDLGDFANKMQSARSQHVNNYLQNTSIGGVAMAILLMAIVPAICEELFFRGIFMKIMLNVNRSPIMAFVFTSLFFAFLHSSIYEFLPIFLASMILCFIYYHSANLTNTIIIHFLVNAIQVLMVVFSNSSAKIASTTNEKLLLGGILLAACGGLYLLLQYVFKNRVVAPQHWNMQTIQHIEN